MKSIGIYSLTLTLTQYFTLISFSHRDGLDELVGECYPPAQQISEHSVGGGFSPTDFVTTKKLLLESSYVGYRSVNKLKPLHLHSSL